MQSSHCLGKQLSQEVPNAKHARFIFDLGMPGCIAFASVCLVQKPPTPPASRQHLATDPAHRPAAACERVSLKVIAAPLAQEVGPLIILHAFRHTGSA